MADDGTRELSAMWIASTLHPERRVAQPTLTALLQLLRRNRTEPDPAGAADRTPGLDQLPTLGAVGGIAPIMGPDGDLVGVARVGRTSFVGYRLSGDELSEVNVALDESTGTLRIGATPEKKPPAA